MHNEKEKNREETKAGKIKEESEERSKSAAKLPEKSEEAQTSERNDNLETITCRNICKEFGRVNIIIHKRFQELISQYVKITYEGISFDL